MEFPDLGQHCSSQTCKQLDFLPMKCDACRNIYCKDHIQYVKHNCEEGLKRDVQVPVCPLCNQPVPIRRGEPPDIRVGEHIDRDCQSDPAQTKRNKLYTKKCGVKGCREKELISVLCPQCHKNFCLRHRHYQDHNCQSVPPAGKPPSKAGSAAMSRLQQSQARGNPTKAVATTTATSKTNRRSIPAPTTNNNSRTPVAPPIISQANQSTRMFSDVQGQLSEDEALALALQNSLLEQPQEPVHNNGGQWSNRNHFPPSVHAEGQPRRSSTSCNIS